MVKRIEKSQLRAGMFVEAVEGFQRDTPFSDRRFMLTLPSDVEAIKSSNITGVFINPTKGADLGVADEPCANPIGVKGLRKHRRQAMPTSQKIAFNAIMETTAALTTVFRDAVSGRAMTHEMVVPIVEQVINSIDVDPSVLIAMTRLKSRDQTTVLHSIAVCALMVRFAQSLDSDKPTVLTLGMSGLLHDIGKLRIPLKVLNKAGRLSEVEMTMIKRHPSIGYEMLSRKPGMPVAVLDVCLHHHERMDGKGYPEGKSAREISGAARMSAICDVYDALTSARPYRDPWAPEQAVAWMKGTDGMFDRSLLSKFFENVAGM
ncbi:HD-GYP domain-containing protein (c-di-GMP phosphodiesterase class II) [Pararhizobium capsulatum DSM 1112]|uniref:HD-GYP domain-containing protein (C-di-GMP phosphodiesterase class II) n=1 Tax=Pararhizobium capsulatum DSM 1112 TaxID=1121113 RepID=A0ABU0BXV6_9HYPH|nr:HD-GYP domain-containing protein [Pararhizobium capsulatum]MDQ0323096.1 HD-GYP domain-containing protein (c-di-GMP phosphodiesterase class II) [Pararhizobium capsulatum DSM 1112]